MPNFAISSAASPALQTPFWRFAKSSPTISAGDCIALILRHRLSVLDLRSEGEYERGALPLAVNLPILTNPERTQVGTIYKRSGKNAAIAFGESLVDPLREARVQRWRAFFVGKAERIAYCARGGLRSQIAQYWLADSKTPILRVEGGYKSLRVELLRQLALPFRCLVLGGLTGSGKTAFLQRLASRYPQLRERFIDLESLAKHRGSAFGKMWEAQPTPANFENRLALDLFDKLRWDSPLIFEDESSMIGKIHLAKTFYGNLTNGDFIFLERPLAERREMIYQDYVVQPLQKQKPEAVADSLRNALFSIAEKLGNERTRKVAQLLGEAMHSQDKEQHLAWIQILLEQYYDPMYRYSMEKKCRAPIFRGNEMEVENFLLRYF